MPHLFLYQGSQKIIGSINQPSSSGLAERKYFKTNLRSKSGLYQNDYAR